MSNRKFASLALSGHVLLFLVIGSYSSAVAHSELVHQIDRSDARLYITWAMEAVPNVLADPAKPRVANYGALTILGLTCVGVIIWLGPYRSRFKPGRSNSGD